jgi:DNA-binding SARP family transcriptional activator/TolB-like protein
MLELRTLGELRLQGASEAGLSSRRKELTLLSYLARRSPRPVSRADLAELLWGERDTTKARQSLRQALSELKRIVGVGLEAGPDKVWLAAGAVLLDAAAFEQDLTGARWQQALERWEGDFLTGLDGTGGEEFRSWLEAEREGLRRGLRLALSHLIEGAHHTGNWTQGIGWAGQWISLLPFDEEGHRRLIELIHLSGRTAEALVRFSASRRQLAEVGQEPSAAFVQLGVLLERDASRVRASTPGSAALFTPDMVGRGPALAELMAQWEGVLSGSAAVVLVEGEAGIGKSRLCEEFLRRLAQQRMPPFVVRGRGHESIERMPLMLIQDTVASLAPAPGLAAASARTLAELARAAPLLRDRFPGLPDALGSQSSLEDAILDGLGAVSGERPVVLYVEDVPRADPASHRLLRGVLSRISSPVLFLLTARTGDHEPSSAFIELASEFHVRRLKLQALGPHDIEALLRSMLELPGGDRQQLAQRLYSQSGGNPFYTIELTAAMVDEELLTPTESGSWKLTGSQNGQLPLPASVREAVTRRLERLAPETRRMLEAAAVLGRVFDADLVLAVSGLRPNDSATALEELIARRLVRESADSHGSYEFTHEIIARVSYDLLPPERRAALHREAARVHQPNFRGSAGTKLAYQYHRSRAGLRPPRWPRRLLLGGVGAALLLGVGFAFIPAARRASLVTLLTRRTPALLPNRIVIAPLVNQTGDTALAGLGNMAADWIAQGLMRTTEFEVVDPRTSTIAGRIVTGIPAILRDRNPAVALAEETGAGTVVSGDLYRDGDSLRVLMRVTDAGSGKIIRAMPPVSSRVSDPSRLITELGRRVMAAVASAVDTTSRGFSAALGQPPSYEAYSEVSKAWESFFRNDVADVFARLRRATLLDSAYMTPLLMRAYVETKVGDWPAVDTLVHQLEHKVAILTPAERAVLSVLEADLRGDLWARLRAARELMNLTPASVEGYTLAASSALFVNRPRESLNIQSRLDPDRGLLLIGPYYWLNETPALHLLGDHKAEVLSARAALRRFPDLFGTHLNLLLALAAEGDVGALRRELPRITRDDPDPAIGERQKAFYVWRELRAHGHQQAADEWLTEVLKLQPEDQQDTSLVATLLEGDLQGAVGHWDSARTLFAAGLLRHPQLPILLGRLGTAAVHAGDTTAARQKMTELAGLSAPYLFGNATYARARIAAALGDRAAAVDLLRAAWFQGRPLVFDDTDYEDVHSDPEFDSLRSFYPFQALLRSD